MRSGYAVSSFGEATRATRRDRAVAAFLSAAIYVLLALILLAGRSGRPELRPAGPPLVMELLPLAPPPPPEVAKEPPPPVRPTPRRPDPGGSPAPDGAPERVMTPTLPAARPDLTVDLTPVVSPIPTIAPSIATPSLSDVGLALDGEGSAAGRTGELGAGGDGAGGEGRGTGAGSGDGAGSVITLVAPKWVRRPSEADMAPFMPERPRGRSFAGRTLIACRVAPSTAVHDCQVLSEKPKGAGLAEASLAASRIFRVHPPRLDGRIIPDAWVGIPIDWRYRRLRPSRRTDRR